MAIWRRKKIPDPTDSNRTVDVLVVPIVETQEKYSEITLQDGTTVRTKMTPLEVCRVEGRWDAEGNPVYVVKSQNLVVVDDVPDDLRRPSRT